MPRDDEERDDSLEFQPVERRQTPRGPIPGVQVEVLQGAPLANNIFEVGEVGVDSLFIRGDLAAQATSGQPFHVALSYHGEREECAATCVRNEVGQRVGAVIKLDAEASAAIALLKQALNPSGIPVGQD